MEEFPGKKKFPGKGGVTSLAWAGAGRHVAASIRAL
jgi:hypothetical protein